MKCKKIFCLIGYSNTGKDSILKEVLKKESKVKSLVSYTTRPMRVNEEEGREYFFIDKDKFFNMDEKNAFIEKREYHTKVKNEDGQIVDTIWYYGFSKKVIESQKYGICIIDANGFNLLKHHYGRNVVVPIYIQANNDTLMQRAIARGDLPEEIERRLEDDYKAFFDFRLKTVFETINNEDGNLEESVKQVLQIINKYITAEEQLKSKSNKKKK